MVCIVFLGVEFTLFWVGLGCFDFVGGFEWVFVLG